MWPQDRSTKEIEELYTTTIGNMRSSCLKGRRSTMGANASEDPLYHPLSLRGGSISETEQIKSTVERILPFLCGRITIDKSERSEWRKLGITIA